MPGTSEALAPSLSPNQLVDLVQMLLNLLAVASGLIVVKEIPTESTAERPVTSVTFAVHNPLAVTLVVELVVTGVLVTLGLFDQTVERAEFDR